MTISYRPETAEFPNFCISGQCLLLLVSIYNWVSLMGAQDWSGRDMRRKESKQARWIVCALHHMNCVCIVPCGLCVHYTMWIVHVLYHMNLQEKSQKDALAALLLSITLASRIWLLFQRQNTWTKQVKEDGIYLSSQPEDPVHHGGKAAGCIVSTIGGIDTGYPFTPFYLAVNSSL